MTLYNTIRTNYETPLVVDRSIDRGTLRKCVSNAKRDHCRFYGRVIRINKSARAPPFYNRIYIYNYCIPFCMRIHLFVVQWKCLWRYESIIVFVKRHNLYGKTRWDRIQRYRRDIPPLYQIRKKSITILIRISLYILPLYSCCSHVD